MIPLDLSVLPNPVIGEDSHYASFSTVFGKDTSGSIPPSLNSKKQKGTQSLGFNATQQHAKNTNTVIQCEECGMWRLVFSKKNWDFRA